MWTWIYININGAVPTWFKTRSWCEVTDTNELILWLVGLVVSYYTMTIVNCKKTNVHVQLVMLTVTSDDGVASEMDTAGPRKS